MKNLDKMNQLVGTNSDAEQVAKWAYMNRVELCTLPFEEEFESMKASVEHFTSNSDYWESGDEHKSWAEFLEAEYVEGIE